MAFSGINSYNYVSPYAKTETTKKTTDSSDSTASKTDASENKITKEYISKLASASQKSYNSSLISGFNSANKLSGMGSVLSDMSSSFTTLELMKSGAYSKLVNKYYSQMNAEDTTAEKAAVDSVKKSAVELNKAASAVSAKSLFNAKDITDEKKRENILAAAKSFVSAYNDNLDSVADVNDTKLLKKGVSMVSMTAATSGALSRVGITVGDDNKLSIDEEKFSKASFGELEAVFSGNNSYAAKISQKAAMMVNNASVSGYTANGSYNYTYTTNGILNTMF